MCDLRNNGCYNFCKGSFTGMRPGQRAQPAGTPGLPLHPPYQLSGGLVSPLPGVDTHWHPLWSSCGRGLCREGVGGPCEPAQSHARTCCGPWPGQPLPLPLVSLPYAPLFRPVLPDPATSIRLPSMSSSCLQPHTLPWWPRPSNLREPGSPPGSLFPTGFWQWAAHSLLPLLLIHLPSVKGGGGACPVPGSVP